jgi:hypothetical protein
VAAFNDFPHVYQNNADGRPFALQAQDHLQSIAA